ncbi:MAG: hypothetical protein ACOYD0_00090 [Candidatus Nanopelagicales bacterium]
MQPGRGPANPRRLAVRLGLPVVFVILVVTVFLLWPADRNQARTGDGSVCAPGAPQWMQIVTSEPVMQPPDGATAVTRNAVLSCYEFPLVGNLGPDNPEVSATMGFATQDSDEQILTGLQLAAGMNDWEESTEGPSAGCLVKVIDGVASYLAITAGNEQNYEVAVSRANPDICAGSQR